MPLENIDKMPQSLFDEIIEKYIEMNIDHSYHYEGYTYFKTAEL